MAPTVEVALIGAMPALFSFILGLLNRQKIAAVAVVADKTHTLVNSQMGNVLRIGKISAQSLYEKDPSPENLALLQEAQRMLDDHTAKQQIVDERN
jgi:hypothetical protein